MGTWCGITCITKAVSWWQVSCTSVQLGEPNGNDGTWTMTGTKCAAIKRLMLMSIMRSGNKTEFLNRRKTPDLIKRNGGQRDQIQMPMDEVPTEEVATQQTLAVLLCFINPRVRKIRNEASSSPGILLSLLEK